jgi:hypothetical protein
VFDREREGNAMTQQGGELNTGLFRTNLSISGKRHKEICPHKPAEPSYRFDNAPIVDELLVAFATETTRYFRVQNVIGDFHLTPRELLEKYGGRRWRLGSRSGMIVSGRILALFHNAAS